MADNEISLDRQDPAEAGKQADKSQKETDGVTPPVLVEFTVTLSAIFLVLVFFTIVGISLVTGANLLDFVVRTSISILVIGSLLVVIARQISFWMLSGGTSEHGQSGEYDELDMQSPSEVK